jgi:hypothetical protein
MKLFVVLVTVICSLGLLAHEGGHGEVSEGGKFGGVMSPIVEKSEAGKGNDARFL